MPDSPLYIYHMDTADGLLGPGKRLVLWLSGCPHHCPGCIEQKRWPLTSGTPYAVAHIQEHIKQLLPQFDGLTVSGGDPLYQAAPLYTLLQGLRADISDLMLFTGYECSELSPQQHAVVDLCDIVVPGRYIQEQGGNFLWRGSANQSFISPTGKYNDELTKWMQSPSAGISIKPEEESLLFIGIPPPGMQQTIVDHLECQKIHLREL